MPTHSLIVSPLWLLPLWAIFLIVAASLMFGHEVGLQLRRRTAARDGRDSSEDGIGGNYLTASLGLLALLVGFSFGMAVDRYNTRRDLVSEEANAISTTFRRIQALDEPHRANLTRVLLPYAEAREAFSHAATQDHLRRAESRTDALQTELWSRILEAVGARDPAARPVLDASDSMFNAAASRRAAVEAVIPRVILVALLLYATLAAIFMGYSHPLTRRYFLASTVQFVLLALAFALIMDLDRPRTGLVEVSQAPLYRATDIIRRAQTPQPAQPEPVPRGSGDPR